MSRLSAIVAMLALVAAGCAPPVVGGTWHTGAVTPGALIAQDVAVEFIDGSSVRGTVTQGGLSTCAERHTRTMSGTWRMNGDKVFVYFFCDVEVACGSGTINLCDVLDQTVVGNHEQRSVNELVSVEHPGVRLTRR